MIVIGIIGAKAAGKELLANYLAKKYNGVAYSHSETLYAILRILELPCDRENAIRLVALRKTFGNDILIKALNKKLALDDKPIKIVTGIRFRNELDNIKSYPNNKLIYLDAPEELRYKWQLARGEKSDDGSMSYIEFLEFERRETEVNIKTLGLSADYRIDNSQSKQSLFDQADKIIQTLI